LESDHNAVNTVEAHVKELERPQEPILVQKVNEEDELNTDNDLHSDDADESHHKDKHNLQHKLNELGPDLICHHCGKVFKHRSTLKEHYSIGGTIENRFSN
jgi:L-lysine 2,3-aminomutase